MHMLEHECDRVVGLERHETGEHLPGGDADRVQVALRRGLVVLDHLRRQVGGRAEQHVGGGQRGLRGGLGQSEVGDLHAAAVVEQDVLRLDVAVHHADAVRGGQAVQRLGQDAQRLAHREGALRVHLMTQVHAVDVLHDQIVQPVVLAGVVHLHDVGVGDGRGGLGLAPEPFDELLAVGALRQLGMHDLDGHRAIQPLVRGLVDRGHAAFGDAADNTVSSLDHKSIGDIRGFSHGGASNPWCWERSG